MCELQFAPVWLLRKRTDDEGKVHRWKVPKKDAIMAYNRWSDEIVLNTHHDVEYLMKKYPFVNDMLEDETAAILSHEATHKVIRNTAGWTAAKKFDKVSPWWALNYWMDPP